MLQMNNATARQALKAAQTGARAAFLKCGRPDREEDVIDVAQTAMIKVIEGFNSEKGANLDGFAYRIGYNTALDALRGAAGTMAVTRGTREGGSFTMAASEEGDEGDMLDSSIECADPAPLAHERMERSEFMARLHAAIDELPEAQRDAIKADLAADGKADLSGAQRVSKTRAIKALQKSLGL